MRNKGVPGNLFMQLWSVRKSYRLTLFRLGGVRGGGGAQSARADFNFRELP